MKKEEIIPCPSLPTLALPVVKTGRRFCWTLNNYTAEECKSIREFAKDCKYLVFGYENGAALGTPHLQGFTVLKKPKTLSGFKKAMGTERLHVENAFGSDEEAAKYCKKDGNVEEFGSLEKNQGHRSDVDKMKDAIMAGKPWMEVFQETPMIAIAHRNAIIAGAAEFAFKKTKEEILKEEFADFKMRDWQATVFDMLTIPSCKPINIAAGVNPIIWVFDTEGGCGKSHFARWMEVAHNAFRIENNRLQDIAHAYNGEPIVIFDLARSQQESIKYDSIELISNGTLFASKYDSRMKLFKKPRVVVFANHPPEMGKISDYRLAIFEVKGKELNLLSPTQAYAKETERLLWNAGREAFLAAGPIQASQIEETKE